MRSSSPWSPESGPWPPPKSPGWRGRAKRWVLRLAAVGGGVADSSRGVAILAYHGTPKERRHPWWLDFRGHMRLLDELGYRVIPLAQAVELVRKPSPPDEPTVAITFDDGWANNLEEAFPELARRRWASTVFVTTSFVGRRPFLGPDELRELTDMGVEVGLHTHRHPDLRELDDESIREEIERCRDEIERAVRRRPGIFCYPFGSVDGRVRDVVAASGVDAACTGIPGWNPPGTDPLLLRRVTLDPGDGAQELRARLGGGVERLHRLVPFRRHRSA